MLPFAARRLGERKIKSKKGLTQRRKDAKKGFKTKTLLGVKGVRLFVNAFLCDLAAWREED